MNNNNNKGLIILQWNACGLKSMGRGDELKAFLNNWPMPIDIVCIQETWLLNKGKKLNILNYNKNQRVFYTFN